ncbi:unnamed protein product [Protopolystoma xenopodis]|uniref:Uncharacterized protein n=1 Tax=Protopolystoma xenopodis TaxID=117903 RepID=A0A3S5FC55_9PLAT|nr:unnamed protein product [Protopolystoma xenopodis]
MSSLGPFTCLADSDNSPLERGIPLNSGSLMTSAPQHVSVLPSTPTSVKIISTPLTNSAQLPQTQHITVCGTSLSDTNVPVVSAGDTDSGLCTLAQPRVNSIPLLSLSPSLFGQLLSSLIPQPDQPNPELVATSIASSTHTSLFPGYLPTSCLHQAATTANAIPASSGTAIIVSNPALPGQTPSPSDVTNAPHDAMAMTTRQLVWQAARHDGLTTTSIPTNSIRPLTHAPAQIMNSKVSAKVADSQPVLKLPPNSLVLLVDGTNYGVLLRVAFMKTLHTPHCRYHTIHPCAENVDQSLSYCYVVLTWVLSKSPSRPVESVCYLSGTRILLDPCPPIDDPLHLGD